MRLWHKNLIPYLPRQQLLGQWRECCLIAKNIAENGTPNHILVNKIMDYPIYDFIKYTALIVEEMRKRGYKPDASRFDKYNLSNDKVGILAFDMSRGYITNNYVFSGWHNERYLRQCIFNLEEKYDCGGITKDEWEKIREYTWKHYDSYNTGER